MVDPLLRGLGVPAVAKFYRFLDETHGDKAPYFTPRTVGMLMISIGLIALVFANAQHGRALKGLRARHPDLPGSTAGATAVVIMLLGVLAFAVALL